MGKNAGDVGQESIKALNPAKIFNNQKYDWELKLLGKFGDHRLYGNVEPWLRSKGTGENIKYFKEYIIKF